MPRIFVGVVAAESVVVATSSVLIATGVGAAVGAALLVIHMGYTMNWDKTDVQDKLGREILD